MDPILMNNPFAKNGLGSGELKIGSQNKDADTLTGLPPKIEAGDIEDTVTISEQGKAMQQESDAGEQGFSGGAGISSGPKTDKAEEEKGAADQARKNLLRQIQNVKEKLQEAEVRLAEAKSADNSDKSQSSDPAEALAEAAGALMGDTEVKTIEAEIKMLNNQLQVLNLQLMEMSQNSSGGMRPGGSAGIGGESNGPSGQGQRIDVNA